MADSLAYTTGGTVQAGSGVYISRQADRDLLNCCLRGEFAYILASRQVGKSSLMVNVARELRQLGVKPVVVDLTSIGQSGVDAERWFLGILSAIESRLHLAGDVFEWWEKQPKRSYSDRFIHFFKDRVLAEVSERIVVFFDEIDTTLGLGFTDDFFAAIRYLQNARSEEPVLARLSFVLIGVATPTDLIAQSKRTPFNVGGRIDLQDFTADEVLVLVGPLGLNSGDARQMVERVLFWTGGHPYFTQRLLRAIAQEEREYWNEQDVNAVVERLFFGDESSRDSNLEHVASRLSKDGPYTYRILSTYANVLRGLPPVFDNDQSQVKAHLKLSGVVTRKGLVLVVRNRIYERVFNSHWVKEQRAIRHERAFRLASGIAVIFALVAAVLAAFSWTKALEAEKSAVDAAREKVLREYAQKAQRTAEAQQNFAEQQRSLAEQETQRADENARKANANAEKADATARKLVSALEAAGLSRTEALKQARLAADSASLAKQGQIDAEVNQQKAVANATQAQANLELANKATHDVELKNKQILVYKLISDANLMRVAQADRADEAALINIEAYRLPEQDNAASADAIQGLASALDKLPKIVANPHWPDGGGISSVALNADGSRMASGQTRGRIHTITLPGDNEASPASLPHEIVRIAFRGNSVVAIDQAGNATPGLPSSGGQRVLALKPDGSAYVSISPDAKTLNYWSGDATPRPLIHRGKVKLAAFLDRGARPNPYLALGLSPPSLSNSRGTDELYVLCDDNSVTIWKLDSFKPIRIELSDSGSANATLFAAAQPSINFYRTYSSRFFLGSGNLLRLYTRSTFSTGWWPFDRLKSVARLSATLAHDSPIGALVVTPESDFVTTATGSVVHRWNLSTARETFRQEMGQRVTALAVSADGRMIATASNIATGGAVKVWLAETGSIVAKRSGPLSGAAVAFLKADQVMVAGADPLRTWNWRTDAETVRSTPDSAGSTQRLFSENGRGLFEAISSSTLSVPAQAAAQGGKGTARSVPSRSFRLSDLSANSSTSLTLSVENWFDSISPDGQFAALSTGGALRLFGAATFTIDHPAVIRHLAVRSGTGQVVAALNDSVEIIGSDGKTMKTLDRLTGPVDFSWDGKYLAVAAAAGVRFFNAADWSDTGWHLAQTGVSQMVFSPDARSLAVMTAGTGGATTRIWDIRTGTQIAALAPPSPVTSLAFSPDGQYVATVGSDGIRVWVWRPDDLVTEICSRVTNPVLSPEEWKKYLGDEPFHPTCPTRN